MSIPSFGVGTFRLTGQTVIDSVRNALDVGYRAVDTAQIYGNEAEVGTAIAQSGVPRADLFVTTKIWTENYAKPKLVASLRESLQKLRTDYVDLTLIHWPAPDNGVELAEYMAALAEAKALGLTRQIGISNFNIELTKQAIAAVGQGEIATNQIELSPYLQNRKLAAFLKEQGIAVTSYMTLAYGKVTDPDGNVEYWPAKFTGKVLKAGSTIEIAVPNSGGYGDPLDRDPARVAADVLDGFTTVELAERDYGVVLDAAGDIDEEATERLRERLREERLAAAR